MRCRNKCTTHCPSSAPKCHIFGCYDDSTAKVWARLPDRITRQHTGRHVIMNACEPHKLMLIAEGGGEEV